MEKNDTFDFDPGEWHFDGRHDIAVIPLDEKSIDDNKHHATLLAGEFLLTKEESEKVQLGPGEDVFMVGRFIDHDGKETNRPAVRFGNISVMPTPIMQSNGKKADSYIIDCHSRTGFSGSPVFVYRTPGSDLNDFVPPDTPFAQKRILMAGRTLLNLLGIHWAQFPEEWDLKDKKKAKPIKHSSNLAVDGKVVEGVSGMTCVLPAWKILEVLNMPKLKELRQRQDEEWEKEGENEVAIPTPESKLRSDSNPSHKEDFTRLVNEAVKKQPQDR